jgi:hypothetical protein
MNAETLPEISSASGKIAPYFNHTPLADRVTQIPQPPAKKKHSAAAPPAVIEPPPYPSPRQ